MTEEEERQAREKEARRGMRAILFVVAFQAILNKGGLGPKVAAENAAEAAEAGLDAFVARFGAEELPT